MTKTDYLQLMPKMNEFCDQFKKTVIEYSFTLSVAFGGKQVQEWATNEWFCYTPMYTGFYEPLKSVISVCDILGIELLEKTQEQLNTDVNNLSQPEIVKKKLNFVACLDNITATFLLAKKDIEKILASLSPEEIERLNEAIHDYLEGCNYSAVAMSVSAIEYRLLQLMKLRAPNEKFDRATLGELIEKALTDNKYAKLIPDKHEPLLQLCNKYRIFSVHAKREKITKALSASVLNLTFLFLLDRSMMPTEEKLQATYAASETD